jgi:aspartate kinase
VKEAKTIQKISFNEAAELATFGARVLHPKTILPAVKKNIPVRILNSFNPSAEGTTILNEVENSVGIVKAIALKKNITLFNITSTRMLLAHGFLAKLFEVFNKYKVSVDMLATSEVSVSLTIDSNNEDEKLNKIVAELREIGDVTVEKNKSIICLVGAGMKNTGGVIARILSTVAKNNINIDMVSQGASEINVGFIVDGKDAKKAVQCLHSEFFD